MYLVLFLFLVTLGDADRRRSKEGWAVCIEEDVDEYLDKILNKSRESIPEPMRLPPRRAFVDLSEGRVWGMNEIYRSGPVKVECKDDDQTAIITGEITTDEMKVISGFSDSPETSTSC